MTPEQKAAFDEYQRSVDEFTNQGVEEYAPDYLGDSLYGQIQTDPRYREYELAALRSLEDQAREGVTAQDRAAMAQTKMEVDRANRGRIGAIQQSMQSRGIAGSGLDLVAQLQSAQDANEVAAMRALETDALAADRRSQGSQKLGSLSSSLQSRDFQQQAARAQAQDNINRFNNENRNESQRFNINNRQGKTTANFQAKTGLADRRFDIYTDQYNRDQAEKEAKRRRRAGTAGAVVGALGGIAGGVLGSVAGPLGAATGASIGASAGNSLGQAAGGGYAEGGRIPGAAPYPGDDPRNDLVHARLSPGEVIIPRTISSDPMASAAYVAGLNNAGPKQSFYEGGMVEPGQVDARDLRLFEPNPYPPVYGPELSGAAGGKDPFASIKSPLVRNYLQQKALEKNALQQPSDDKNVDDKALDFFGRLKKTFNPDQEPEKNYDKFSFDQYIGKTKDDYETAKNRQAYLDIADTFGKLTTDYANSQRPETIYANRISDLGKAPKISMAPETEWTDLSNIGQKNVEDARKNLEMGLKYQDQELDRSMRAKQFEAQQDSQDLARVMMLRGMMSKEEFAQAMLGKKGNSKEEDAYYKALLQQEKLAADKDKNLSENDLKKQLAAEERAYKEKLAREDLEYKRQADEAKRKLEIELAKQGITSKEKIESEKRKLDEKLENQKRKDQQRKDSIEQERRKQSGEDLPVGAKQYIGKLVEKNAQRASILNELKSFLVQFRSAKSDQEKIDYGNSILKLFNSDQNPDAVGVEEARRIGGNLQMVRPNNVFTGGKIFGPDFEAFEQQTIKKINQLDGSFKSTLREIESTSKNGKIGLEVNSNIAKSKVPGSDEVVVLWKGKNKVIKRDMLNKAIQAGAREVK